MKSKILKIVISILLLVSIVLIYVVKTYNKPHLDTKNSKTDFTITAQKFINEYLQDEISADKKYAEKLIQVKGKIYNISTLKGDGVITLKFPGLESSIICYLLPEDNSKALTLKKGQLISIKGICKGYLLDINMVKCVFVE